MTRDESDILRDHGERLARIETELTNHVRTSIADLKLRADSIDAKLWWILGTMVLVLSGIATSLIRGR